jgi:hypothetical protein
MHMLVFFGRSSCDIFIFVYRWRNMVLLIIVWFKVDYCHAIMSYDCLVYYLIFKWWLRPSALYDSSNIIHTKLLCHEYWVYYAYCSRL